MTYHIALCDDDAVQREYLADLVSAWAAEAGLDGGALVQMGSHDDLVADENGVEECFEALLGSFFTQKS